MKKRSILVVAVMVAIVMGYFFMTHQRYVTLTIKVEDPNLGDSIYEKPTLEGKKVILERVDLVSDSDPKFAHGFTGPDGIVKYLPDLPVPSKWKVSILDDGGRLKYLVTYFMGNDSHRNNHIIVVGSGGSVTISTTKK